MKETKKITLADARGYIKSVELLKSISIDDPIKYFMEKISEMNKELVLLKKGEGIIPDNMTRDEAIEWLAGVLECQKAYLACYQKVLWFTTARYETELDILAKEELIPVALGRFLKEVLTAHIQKNTTAIATDSRIQLAKTYLQGGIELRDSATDYFFDVMLFVPKDDKERSFFVLVKKYPGGELKYLKDV